MAARTALIFGISGQDGAYLAKLLLDKGYSVHGTSRDAEMSPFASLVTLGVRDQVKVYSAAPADFRSVAQVVTRVEPDEIYNLTGQSSVGLSFQQPVETIESITIGTLNMLEALRMLGPSVRFYNAGSGECFGDTGETAADEQTAFRPRSPYAVAKAGAFWEVVNYRDAYGLFACSGILFNHESPLRPSRFVTRKAVSAAARIARGSKEKLALGNIAIRRDWGWAPEYVIAMWRMLKQEAPEDYVIATGIPHSLQEFVEAAFGHFGLNWREHVTIDASLFRPSDIACGFGNAGKAERHLGWKAEATMRDVVGRMAAAELTQKAKASE
ncbi:MAG: GDP-mannose 4,6-dehydratase [Alphaproteobacteria bacterium]